MRCEIWVYLWKRYGIIQKDVSINRKLYGYEWIKNKDAFNCISKQDWHSPVYSGRFGYIALHCSTSLNICMVMQFIS